MSAPIVSARRTAVVMLTLPLLGGLAACSTGGQKLTRSGFLPDYSAMGPTKQHKKDAIFVAADYAPGAYDKVVVEPVEWLAPTRSDETKEKLKADFRSRLVRSFGTKYRVVDASEAGPGTLRIRSAITGTRPGRAAGARRHRPVPPLVGRRQRGDADPGRGHRSSPGAGRDVPERQALARVGLLRPVRSRPRRLHRCIEAADGGRDGTRS
jgi:hypothetical protein